MQRLNVLVACEYSGRVRDAFRRRGHFAVSCDLLPTEVAGPHYQGDVRNILGWGWDVMVGHPSCQFLANSGVRWLYQPDGSKNLARWDEMYAGAEFFTTLSKADIPFIALENPIMHKYARAICGEPTQYIQPYEYGHGETKRTGLWLKRLPTLQPTNIVPGRAPRVHHMAPSPDRWKERSRTYAGIADAMAEQWSAFVLEQFALGLVA